MVLIEEYRFTAFLLIFFLVMILIFVEEVALQKPFKMVQKYFFTGSFFLVALGYFMGNHAY